MLALVHIGMMKAGSSWLFHWLAAHPELAAPFETVDGGKNTYRWNRDNPLARHPKRVARGEPVITDEAYREAVESVPKAIDVTDSYCMMATGELAALRAAHPDVVVTFTMRDPIDALWSHMAMHSVGVDQVERARAAPGRDPLVDRMLANVRIGDNLRRWRASGFDPQLIAFSELERDSPGVLRHVAGLLGIDPTFWDAQAVEVARPINAAERPRGVLTRALRGRLEALVYG